MGCASGSSRCISRRSRSFCAGWGIACRRTSRRGRARSIPTVTRSSGTSTRSPNARSTAGQPVISVDTKKKELVGDFKNAGREWRPKGQPELVRDARLQGQAAGQGDPLRRLRRRLRSGWVNVGVDHDTAQFAVSSIRSWWEHLGQPRYPDATTLQITADCGGSNGNRTRLWKVELQKLADETGLELAVSHFPPGTSKWNRIEHRLFSFITMNWRGKPLVSLETIINLIGATTTSTGLEVYARLDERHLPRQDQSPRRRPQGRQPPRRRVPSRVELHHQTEDLNYLQSLSRRAASSLRVPHGTRRRAA